MLLGPFPLIPLGSWRSDEGFTMQLQRISAITLRVTDMARSITFSSELLGLELLYGGKDSFFSSLRTRTKKDVILNLEEGEAHPDWDGSS